jgi:signal transduction histidine kinase
VPKFDEQLTALAVHLASRREAILSAWRKAVEADPELSTPAGLPRKQFIDHIPDVLDAYERRLLADTTRERIASEAKARESAHEHGLTRWQQGFHLRELTREWGHLHFVLLTELENYAIANPGWQTGAMTAAWRILAHLHSEGVTESTSQFFQLQENEAAGEVKDLELSMNQIRELERQRGELWRQAAHDLRGNASVVANASAGLGLKNIPEAARESFVRLLQKSVSSLQSMLENVMDLARLQAGQEKRQIETFNAGEIFRDLHENLEPMAGNRGLFLRSEGPEEFEVSSDSVKLRRIAQNLLLNAVKYTQKGGVTFRWGESRDSDPRRWMLTVEDTGPGLHAGPAASMKEALEVATEATDAGQEGVPTPEIVPLVSAAAGVSHSLPAMGGEGIGLSIVKRLCELLEATLEVESTVGEGTVFRVIFPRVYAA